MITIDKNKPSELLDYLHQKEWLAKEETIASLSKPGDGNMNYVLRVDTGKRSMIVKQSRGYVEKYPHVSAPAERVVTEGNFYQKILKEPKVQKYMPKLIGLDSMNNIMVIEDLGYGNDFSYLYDLQHKLREEDIVELVAYLNALHSSFQKKILDDELANFALRKLNHEHIFHYPFVEDNGFDLNIVQDGLQELSIHFKNDGQLKRQIEVLGALYMSKGKYLLHGDYYPGSWLRVVDKIKVIDPEFCYYGSREFDLGILLAHLHLTNQDSHLLSVVISEYDAYSELNLDILNGFTGVEIMRRLIGLAQLPLSMDLKTKKQLLEFARKLILNN